VDLETLQRDTFGYFIHEANSNNGLDRAEKGRAQAAWDKISENEAAEKVEPLPMSPHSGQCHWQQQCASNAWQSFTIE